MFLSWSPEWRHLSGLLESLWDTPTCSSELKQSGMWSFTCVLLEKNKNPPYKEAVMFCWLSHHPIIAQRIIIITSHVTCHIRLRPHSYVRAMCCLFNKPHRTGGWKHDWKTLNEKPVQLLTHLFLHRSKKSFLLIIIIFFFAHLCPVCTLTMLCMIICCLPWTLLVK